MVKKMQLLLSPQFVILFFRSGMIYASSYNYWDCTGTPSYNKERIQEAGSANGGECNNYASLQSRKISCAPTSAPPMPSSFNMLVKYDDGECNNPVQFTALPDGKCWRDQWSYANVKFVYPVVNTYSYSYSSSSSGTCSAGTLQDFRDYSTCTPEWGYSGQRYGRMYQAGTAIVANTRFPSRSPTAAPTGGQLYTVEGDIVLANIDYNSLTESQKTSIMMLTRAILGTLWPLYAFN
jgi:hypothetical protein